MFGASLIRSNNNLSSITEEGGAAIPPVEPQPFGTLYKFTQVFSSDSQAAFFRATTLPMVHDFLKGQNCLLFAYGPTGSGKTWTVQGGEGEGAGLLPRVMDVVCRSLKGKENRANVSGLGLSGRCSANFSEIVGQEDAASGHWGGDADSEHIRAHQGETFPGARRWAST